MPRDEWARANARAKYGATPFDYKKPKWKASQKKKKPAKHRLAADKISKRFNPHSKLRFGMYAKREIKDIPEDYLRWIVRNVKQRNARMQGLVLFLKRYLQGPQTHAAKNALPQAKSVDAPANCPAGKTS